MNKKVLTLCAGFLLAGSSVAFAESFTLKAGDTGYAIQGGQFSFEGVINVDESSAVSNPLFPAVSPFAVTTANGAKPIVELENVNGTADSRYFQFVVGSPSASGKEVLTMVWVKDGSNQGHYELQVESVSNANILSNRIILDRTLWKVTAKKETTGAGNTLYYTLQNKATDAILQVSTSNAKSIAGIPDAKEVELKIVAGQTQWRWAEGEKAASGVGSRVDNTVTSILKDQFSAQFSNGTTLYLAKKTAAGSSAVTLTGLLLNSNATFDESLTTGLVATNGDKYEAVVFESWEANPIILTADQINSELGNDYLADNNNDGKFNFTFDPDVQGDTNIMLSGAFTAEAPIADATKRVPGDAADGFVRFKNANGEYLHVDTAYYHEALNGRYALKMNVGAIQYSRYAVAATSGLTVVDGKLVLNGTTLSNAAMYDGTNVYPAVQTYVQMKRQSNFRPVFYPSTQSLRLQAEMIYKAGKRELANGESWWEQMSDDATANSGDIQFAGAALDPTKNPESQPNEARGYYPAFAYDDLTLASNTRILAYEKAWSSPNGYELGGTSDATNGAQWNAVANIYNNHTNHEVGDYSATNKNGWVLDPAESGAASPIAITSANAKFRVFNPAVTKGYSNVVRLTSLTDGHIVLTTDAHDVIDETYDGLNTIISIDGLRGNSALSPIANIPEGFYYIRNANQNSTQLANVGDYRYEDLAATNAMFTYWNTQTEKWDRGVSHVADVTSTAAAGTGATASDQNATKANDNINADMHKTDNANIGNLVYSADKLTIPSAQWYIKGNGDHYVMINRESGRQWGTEYWWATNDPQVFVNQATYTDAAGQQITYRDTIRLESVPAAELTNPYLGYLNLTQEEAMADTTVYNIGMTSLGDVNLSLSVDANGNMVMTPDSTGAYKLERVLVTDEDPYEANEAKKVKYTTDLYYGFAPTVNGEIDTTKMLVRAKYYIYKDEVNANSGIEPSSIKTREYITLNGGKYQLSKVQVQFDNNYYTTEVDGQNVRREFYVKQITPNANQFVLVDPEVVSTVDNNTGTDSYGARVFVNQLSAELQPGSLKSDGFANPYATSIFNFSKAGKQNYADIRANGADRDTVEFFVANAPTYKLGENSQIKGAKVGLLDLRAENADINTAIFVDTANVNNAACPRFLLGVRDYDKYETSNLDHHNRHLWTKAAYLVNLKDSVDVNPAYYYRNIDQNSTTYYRLGFLDGTHKGTTLTLDNGTKFELSDEALGENGLNIATFAFRYCDTSRENFYIETMYDDNTRGWICIHNGVAAVTKNIQEAEVFSMAQNENIATSNEAISAEEGAVSVVATDGAVIVKGAEGKNVVIATILGKVVANETINSDNETIAVPAGIAVVSVDGESFKVVVK